MYIQFADQYLVDPSLYRRALVLSATSVTGCGAILERYSSYRTVREAWLTVDGARIPPDQVGFGKLGWIVDGRYVGSLRAKLVLCGGFSSEPYRRELELELDWGRRQLVFGTAMTLSLPAYDPSRRTMLNRMDGAARAETRSGVPSLLGGHAECPRCSGKLNLYEGAHYAARCPWCLLALEPQAATFDSMRLNKEPGTAESRRSRSPALASERGRTRQPAARTC